MRDAAVPEFLQTRNLLLLRHSAAFLNVCKKNITRIAGPIISVVLKQL